MKIISSFLFLIFLLTFHLTVFGADYYASPTGLSTNSGAIGSPWNLQTALGKTTECAPANTFYLRGGTYSGKFTSTLDGCTVRSYTGEWAQIDGYLATTSTTPISDARADTTITLRDPTGIPSGSVVIFGDTPDPAQNEHISLGTRSGNSYEGSTRGWDGTRPQAHAAGAPVVLSGNELIIVGPGSTYRDFEILNSNPVRNANNSNTQDAPAGRGTVSIRGENNNLINLRIHDLANGILTNNSAQGTLIYGCLIYNNGYGALALPRKFAGHGIYTQNSSGTFVIKHTAVLNNYFFGMQIESTSGDTVGYTVDGAIAANNGAIFGAAVDSTVRRSGILLGAQIGSTDNDTIKNSFFYQPAGVSGGAAIRFGYSAPNKTGAIINNKIMGGREGIAVYSWSNLTITGNTIYVEGLDGNGNADAVLYGPLPTCIPKCPPTNCPTNCPICPTINWNNNSYTNFGTGTTTPFGYIPTLSNYDFEGWKGITCGFDANSAYSPAARTGDDVFVVPNEYEVGRASIVAYNWDSSPTVAVDLSAIGLSNGQRYEIRNAFDHDHPPIIGVYDSGAPIISLNVSQAQWGTVAASPIGSGVSIPGTWPRYFVGLVKSVPGATTAKNADFDGDGRTDLSVFRPSDRNWYVSRSSDSGFQVTAWGLSTDILTPGDYDGDGKTDHAVFRPSDRVWYILQSSTNTLAALQWGISTDIPVAGDYDGDGKTDRAIWREGTWWVFQSTNQKPLIVNFGQKGDIPFVGDLDGDRKADFAFARRNTTSSATTWNILRSTGGTVVTQFGLSDDKLVPADFDGDGTTDFGVWRPSTGIWYTAPSSEPNPGQNFTALPFGQRGDIPVPGDYNGDGKYDRAVFRKGTWWIQDIPNNTNVVQFFGASGDKPVPNAYFPQ